jgi:hypothetical protein
LFNEIIFRYFTVFESLTGSFALHQYIVGLFPVFIPEKTFNLIGFFLFEFQRASIILTEG